jgi:soluble lytic murein transglycosylase-like protein
MSGVLDRVTQNALQITANDLKIPAEWLENLIRHESAFNPTVKNPNSSARGLIQFTDAAAKKLGYKDSADLVSKHPDSVTQLMIPVKNYLKQYAPFPNEQSLYMAVFYPAYRNVDPRTPFPAAVKAANPGINTPMDYINRVKRLKTSAFGMALVAAATFLYLLFKRR